MARKKVQMSPWERLPGHSWTTVRKTRQDPSGDVVEEVTGARAAPVGLLLGWVIAGTGWWWQSTLDGSLQPFVIAATVLISVYVLMMTGWVVAILLFSRFVRNA